MSGLPSPADAAVKFIVWLGVPGVVGMVILSAQAAWAWVAAGRSGIGYATSAATTALGVIRYWTSERQRSFFKLTAASAVFVAITYAVCQVATATFHPGSRLLSDGHIEVSDLIDMVSAYTRWPSPTVYAVTITAGSVLLLNLAHMAHARFLVSLIVRLWSFILGLAALASAYGYFTAAIDMLGILVTTDHKGDPLTVGVLTATLAIFLSLLVLLGGVIRDASAAVFTLPVVGNMARVR